MTTTYKAEEWMMLREPGVVAKHAEALRELATPQTEMLAMRLEDLRTRLKQVEADSEALKPVIEAVEGFRSGELSAEEVNEACRTWLEAM